MRLLFLLALGVALPPVGGFVSHGGGLVLRGPDAQGRCVTVGPRWVAVLDKIPLDKIPLPKSVKPGEETWGELGASLKRFAGAAPGGIKKQMEEQVLPMAKAVIFKEKPAPNAPAADADAPAAPEAAEQKGVGRELRRKREFFADMGDMAAKPAPAPAAPVEASAPVVVGDVGVEVGDGAEVDPALQQIEELLSVSVADEIMPKELSQEWMDSDTDWDGDDEWDRPSPSWMIESPNKHP